MSATTEPRHPPAHWLIRGLGVVHRRDLSALSGEALITDADAYTSRLT